MLAAGTQIGRYEVTRKLAEGGMAEIYLARAVGPEGFSKEVVIKVVRSFLATDQQFVQMFIAEARLASRLNHANVVQIFDFGKHEDTYYLAMEYVRGASLWDLRQRCRQQGVPFPPVLAAEIAAQIARGLQYAHSLADKGQKLGVVHRDVTPHNVLLSFDGAVKLTDFGIAKAQTTHTAPGMLKGKFAYMSPEQARGEPVDARTDIFALGIVLWELLTGGRLFDGDSELAVLRAVEGSVIAPPARLNPDVPAELSDIVMKALARPLPERFQTAFEFEKALATWVLRTAQSMEDTSVALFLQSVYAAELAEDARLGTPARGVGAVSRVGDDLGSGDTLAVDRSQQHAKDSPQHTMTMTPVRQAPRSATPRPRGIMDDDDELPPSSTEKFQQVGGTEQLTAYQPAPRANTDEMPATSAPRRPGTEQMPAYKPGSGVRAPMADAPQVPTDQYRPPSRRLEPIAPVEPSQVAPRPEASTKSVSVSATEPAAPDELPGAQAPSRAPLIAAVAVVVLAILGTAGYFATRTPEAPPPEVTTARVEPSGGVKPPSVVEPTGLPVETPTGVVDAGAEPERDSGPAAAPPPEEPKPTEVHAGTHLPPPPPPPTVAKKPATGLLTVRAVPYAAVFDGKTPLVTELQGTRTFRLSVGAHEIVFKHPARTEKRKVVIKADETETLNFDAQQ